MPDRAEQIDRLMAERDIRRLMTLYCRGADRADLPLLRSIFHADAHLDFGRLKGGVDDFLHYAASLDTAAPSQHHITNMLVETDGDHAEVETYCIVIHGAADDATTARDWTVFVRYLNRVDRHAGRWLIKRHVVVWDWNRNGLSTARWDGPLHPNHALRPARAATMSRMRSCR